jgi:dihydropyrimidinase
MVRGVPTHTVSGGKLVFKQGDLLAVAGAGQHVDRPAFSPMFDALQQMAKMATPAKVMRS